MNYKGYEITAEVQSYDIWTVDENGSLADWKESMDGVEVTGYFFNNEDTGDDFHESMSDSDAEALQAVIDKHLAEKTDE